MITIGLIGGDIALAGVYYVGFFRAIVGGTIGVIALFVVAPAPVAFSLTVPASQTYLPFRDGCCLYVVVEAW